MSINPSQDWGVLDSELWLLYMTPTIEKVPTPQHECYKFNNKGIRNKIQCAYAHRCLKCNKLFPAIRCTPPYNFTQKKRLHTTPHHAGQTFSQCLILVEMFAHFKTKTHKASISQTCKAKPLLPIHTNTKLGNLP